MQKKLQDGHVNATTANWPAFLYYGNIPGEDFDPAWFNIGFLCGFVLVWVSLDSIHYSFEVITCVEKVLKHIFMSPSSVLSSGDSKSTHPGNGKLHGMHEVTAEHITYSAVHVGCHFAIIIRA